jgi:hypothetical protein
MKRDPSDGHYVYVWVGEIRAKGKLGHDERLCYLVMAGVRFDDKKELAAAQDGYRKSSGL